MEKYKSIKEAKFNYEMEIYEFDLRRKKENLWLMIDDISQIEHLAKKNNWEEIKNKKGYLKYYIDHKNQKDYYIYK